MSTRTLPIRITEAWVRLYTRGLDSELRADRRAELASDIWEQTRESSGGAAGWLVLLRCLLGMPADLSWRLEHAAPGSAISGAAASMLARCARATHWVTSRGLPGLSALMSWLYLLGGSLILVTLPISRNPDRAGVAVFGAWCLVAGGMMWKGNSILERRPVAGAGLVLGGAVPLGLALYMTVVMPVATAAIAWTTVSRARRSRENARWLPTGRYLPILLRGPQLLLNTAVRGVQRMFSRVLAFGEPLLAPTTISAGRKRTYVLRGAAIGLMLGVLGRIWMRLISQDPQFTPGGTGLILVVFTGLGALTGLSIAWRRFGTRRRLLVVRGVAWAPFLMMGPFMPLFLPGLGLAAWRSHTEWGRRRRRIVKWGSYALLSFVVLIMLGAEQGPGLLAASLYLLLAWALYFSNRLALSIRSRPAGTPGLGDRWWARSRPNHAGAGA